MKNSEILNDSYFYDYTKPELKQRTRKRLIEILRAGMTEVACGQFGVEGVVSGLCIEYVWSYSDEEFNSYMEWAKGVISKKAKDKMPDRIKYYLLDWKDRNINTFIRKYGKVGLKDLTEDQLQGLFLFATQQDYELIKTKQEINL